MEPVLRTVAIYVALMVLFRMSGKRSLSEVTTFDFILLLIISEATRQALLGQDYSLTTALLVTPGSSWARKDHGLERLEDVKYAVLERNGGISIVPRKPS